MRRERRARFRSYKFFYITGAVAIFLAILLVILYNVYNKKLNDISERMLSSERIIGLVPNTAADVTEPVEATGSTISKTINEIQEQITNELEEEDSENTVQNEIVSIEETDTTEVHSEIEPVEEKKEEIKKELSFEYPVEGEILREFAMEELIYSETLDEWTVHQGIDVKADRTTVVKAAEAGTVTAIKNDPRFGLTVIIEHEDGYKTVYSNLLSTEFVTEDEKVEKGQSIGTVGNSAVFEIADEPHLHFEMIKNGEYVNPKLYLK